ncbi:MAG: hypothetical protein ACRCWJ_21235 [Casimicrobium sp.]
MANVLVARVTIGLGKDRRIETGKQVTEAEVKLLGNDLQRLIDEGHIIQVDVAKFALAKASVESPAPSPPADPVVPPPAV